MQPMNGNGATQEGGFHMQVLTGNDSHNHENNHTPFISLLGLRSQELLILHAPPATECYPKSNGEQISGSRSQMMLKPMRFHEQWNSGKLSVDVLKLAEGSQQTLVMSQPWELKVSDDGCSMLLWTPYGAPLPDSGMHARNQ